MKTISGHPSQSDHDVCCLVADGWIVIAPTGTTRVDDAMNVVAATIAFKDSLCANFFLPKSNYNRDLPKEDRGCVRP